MKRISFLSVLAFILVTYPPLSDCLLLKAVRLSSKLPRRTAWMSPSFDGADTIHLFGGHVATGKVDQVLKYSISSDKLQRLPLSLPYTYLGTVARKPRDGSIFYMGGEGAGARVFGEIRKFSPNKMKLETVSASLPLPNRGSCAVKLNEGSSLVYIFGGDRDPEGIVRFDMESMKTSRVGSLPRGYSLASCVSDNAGSAFLFGGSESGGRALRINLSSYESGWVGGGNLPVQYHSTAVWDGDRGFAYIIGGAGRASSTKLPGDAIVQFDPKTMSYSLLTVTNLPGGKTQKFFATSAVHVPGTNRIYIFGGRVGHEYSDGIWYIDLSQVAKRTMTATTKGATTITTTKRATPTTITTTKRPTPTTITTTKRATPTTITTTERATPTTITTTELATPTTITTTELATPTTITTTELTTPTTITTTELTTPTTITTTELTIPTTIRTSTATPTMNTISTTITTSTYATPQFSPALEPSFPTENAAPNLYWILIILGSTALLLLLFCWSCCCIFKRGRNVSKIRKNIGIAEPTINNKTSLRNTLESPTKMPIQRPDLIGMLLQEDLPLGSYGMNY